MLLRLMGCELRGNCRKHLGWWHFKPAEGWSVKKDEDGLRLIDPANYIRLWLGEEHGKYYLLPVARYYIHLRYEAFNGETLLIAEACDQVTTAVVCRTYRILAGGEDEDLCSLALEQDVKSLLTAAFPAMANALDSWD